MTLEEYIRMLEMRGGSAGPTTSRGPSGMVTPGYTGASTLPFLSTPHNRLTMTKPVGMTDAQVDYWTGPMAEGRSMNIVPRQVDRQFYDPNAINPQADAARKAYGDVARHRETQVLPRGLPSGYGQEEGGMDEPYLGWRPSGTFLRGGEEHDPRVGGRWDFSYGMPTGWLLHDGSGAVGGVKSAGEVGGQVPPMRGREAEEGPAAGSGFSAGALSKASEMIAAAGGNQDYGKAFKAGGGTRKFQPYMTTPQLAQYASPYLRRRKEEEE